MKDVIKAGLFAESVYHQAIPNILASEVLFYDSILDEETQTIGMAYYTENAIWLCFAGTRNRRNWLSNFKIIKKMYGGMFKAHKGFAECAEALQEQCEEAIAKNKDADIYIVGHSLGGAIAVLMATFLYKHYGIRNYTLITFGQPCVTWGRNIKKYFPKRYVRVVNGSDAVPRRPGIGYSHAGSLLYLDNDQKTWRLNPTRVGTFFDRLPTLFGRFGDHSQQYYNKVLGLMKWKDYTSH
jgi:hypothetical protein